MNSHTIFAMLCDALAVLYPKEEDTYNVVTDAGLDGKHISFSPRADTNWHNILAEAVRAHKVDPLLKVALTAYGSNPTLKHAVSEYRRFIKLGGMIDVSMPIFGEETHIYTNTPRTSSKDLSQAEKAPNFFSGQWVIALLGGTISSAIGGLLTTLIAVLLESNHNVQASMSIAMTIATYWQNNILIVISLFICGGIFAVWLNRSAPWYRKHYLKHLIYDHRDFDIKGLTTQGAYTLKLLEVFVELTIKPQSIHSASTDIIPPVPEDLQGQQPVWRFLKHKNLQNNQIAGLIKCLIICIIMCTTI